MGQLSHSERADWLDIIADELESDTKILRLSRAKIRESRYHCKDQLTQTGRSPISGSSRT